MKKLVPLVILATLVSWLVWTQVASPQPVPLPTAPLVAILQGDASANQNGNYMPVAGYNTVGVTVSLTTGTPTFMVNFEGAAYEGPTVSAPNNVFTAVQCFPANGSALVTTATASGHWRCNVTGMSVFRARVSGYTGPGQVRVIGVAIVGGLTDNWPDSPFAQSLSLSNPLTVPNGGTGAASLTGYIKGSGASALVAQTTPIPVSDGGTGAGTYTTNGVLYGAGTGPIVATGQGVTNSVLTASAGAPSFSATPTVTSLTATTSVSPTLVNGTYTLGGTATIAGPTAIGTPGSMGSAAAGDLVFPNGVGGIRFARQDASGTSYAITFGTDDSLQLGLGSLVSAVKMFRNLNLRAGFLYGILTNSSAYTAIASTNVETFFGIGTDGQILAGGINAAKHRIEATFRGIYGVNGATDTITLKAKLCTVSGCGSGTVVQLAATGAVLPGVAVTNQGWEAKVDCNVFTAGVSGTLDCQGFSLFSLTGLTALQADDMVNTTTVTVDTTTDQYLSLSATWNNTSANNTIQLRNLGVKVF